MRSFHDFLDLDQTYTHSVLLDCIKFAGECAGLSHGHVDIYLDESIGDRIFADLTLLYGEASKIARC